VGAAVSAMPSKAIVLPGIDAAGSFSHASRVFSFHTVAERFNASK